jgi:DNA-binding CsgD family transcriptional regulator
VAEVAASVRADGRVTTSAQPLLVVDDDCVCLEASLGACRLLGLAREDVVGRRVDELLQPESRERFARAWRGRSGAGEAGRFAFGAAAAAIEVGASFNAGVLPGRHLVILDPSPPAAAPRPPAGAGAARPPTPRECQILGLLAGGATDTQIASRLELSPATVQTHVRNAKAKLGARTRTQAVALALRRGLIEAG